jgi:ABC-type molybdate transport system substrate-binding protein
MLGVCLGGLMSGAAVADDVSAAAAANFTDTAQALARQFGQKTGHPVVLRFGSTIARSGCGGGS